MLASLRLRYGITTREARSQLEYLKRDFNTPLQEHAETVERLGWIAHAGLPEQHVVEMIQEKFKASLNNLGLQKHLLGLPMPDLGATVRAGNE